ncbi:hypothetical protein [uncultured Proteiniphilum sp.]|uniref:hypothetical protein n=1 Tax=uncultured Proteiniphilum sp. TaxID=497637 RepID=UPI00260F9994|nr:hypothetical protein [uncultured Proteiniphilum sp.]
MIPALHAQEYRWGVGLDYFFDNREYKKSSFTDPQTLHGIWLNMLGGVTWDSTHTIYAGVNLLKIPGMRKAVNKTDVTLYYQYKKPKILLRAGAFPRKEVLPNYSDFFFRDSVNLFMPLMQGVFWQIGKDANFFNAWMDWTGYATANTRESFYLGFSGKASRGILFADFQSYLFHYAGTFPENPAYGVSEQIQGMASAGLEYEAANSFKGLLSAGIFAGLERDRKAGESYKPVGFTARADAELYGIGTENRFYTGDARMRLFPVYGGNLYWGSPFLRGSTYLQSKWYIRLLESDHASARINCNLHFSEGHILFQQTLSITANIGNFLNPEKKKVNYPWMRIFR